MNFDGDRHSTSYYIPNVSNTVGAAGAASWVWDKEDRTSQGFRLWLRPAKIIAGSRAPPPDEKSN